MKFLETILMEARKQAWEDLSDQQREAYLDAAAALITTKRQPKSILRGRADGPEGRRMKPTAEQHARIKTLLAEVRFLRDAIDSDGQNDLGAALDDAAHGLGDALSMIEGRGPGQMVGALCLPRSFGGQQLGSSPKNKGMVG